MRRSSRLVALALGVVSACSLAPTDARAAAAVLFAGSSGARVERHDITVTLSASGAVTWDSIDVSGAPSDIGLVVAVKAGGRVEITTAGLVAATERATRVVVRALPAGVTCNAASAGSSGASGGGFEAGANVTGNVPVESSGGCSGNGSGSGSGSGSGEGSSGCGCGNSGRTATSEGEARGGCLTSSESGCGSCDGDGCEPSDHGHPGCSAIHGCGPGDNFGLGDDDDAPRDGGSSLGAFGPYEKTRLEAGDGSASAWLARFGYAAPEGFLDGILALEASGYEVYGFRARPPADAAIVRSVRVVTTSLGATLPLRLVRMSTGADAAATPVTLIALAGQAQDLTGQPLVSIDESRLALRGGSSNYESLVSEALGTPLASDAGAEAGTDTDAGDGGVALETRWLVESSRSLVSRASADGGAGGTLGDLFGEECGARRPQNHLVCSDVDAGHDLGVDDAGADAAASDAGDAGASDAGVETDGGVAEAGVETDGGCPSVARQVCDDLDLALPSGLGVATRFRGVVAGPPSLVDDLSFSTSAAPLKDARYTVRANGEPGLCAPVDADDDALPVEVPRDGGAACKTVRGRYRVDLGPLVTFLVVLRVLSALMRRARTRG